MLHFTKRLFGWIATGILLAVPGVTQEFRASLSGSVTDSSGGTIVGAKVTALNVERNTTAETVSNDTGRYQIQFLQPGKYTLSVEHPGFKKFVREDLELLTSDRIAVDVQMEVGSTAENVTVTGETPLLQTETASRVANIQNRVLDNVPTNGRNLYQLEYTLPGVVKNSRYWGAMELYAFSNINNVSIGGGRSGENETLIDGVSNTRSDRGVVIAPALNATQEMTVQTNVYDAQFGRVGGGVTQITLKSGTNALHGQLFEFFKNDKLNANDWIMNKQGESRDVMRNNTFGFEVDGPVYIPKVFDGRNRVFFMVSSEFLKERVTDTQQRTLPQPEQLTGDFSNLRNGDGELVTIYDPLTTRPNPNGEGYIRDPFPGNKIPLNRLNPVALAALGYYPKPTSAGDGPGHINNYTYFGVGKNGYDAWMGKMDFRLSDRQNVAVRYGQTPWENFADLVWGGNNPGEPSGEAPSKRISRTGGFDWTYTLSPTMVLNLRGGLARYEGFGGNVYAGDFDPRSLGFPSSLVSQFTTLQFPRFEIGDYSELGADRVTSFEAHDTYSLQPNMSWSHGRHTLKFGAEFRLYNRNQLQPGLASGFYKFDKSWTQADPQQGDSTSGNEFASFLLGHPVEGRVENNIDPAYRNKYYAAFIQDDFKVNSRLTLNLGLRWDYETPRVERYNRMVRGFAFDQDSPLQGKVPGFDLKGGLLYAGSSGDNRFSFKPSRANFQPRVGVAWQFLNNWVLRAGYGMSYLGQSSNGPATGYSRSTPLIASTDGGLKPAVSLSDPFPTSLYPNGLLTPIGNSQGLSTNLGQSVQAQYLDRPLPYVHQFSFGIQHSFRGGWLIDASYVGNITKRLPVSLNLNRIPTSFLTQLPVDQRPGYFTEKVANPFHGLLPDSAFNDETIPRQQLLVPYPQFSQVNITDVPIGSQRYDSFQLSVSRRFSQGLAMQAAYTVSKTLEQMNVLNAQDVDPNNLTDTPLEKRLIEYDIPQKFSFTASYDLPFGRSRRFFNQMHPVLNGIFGNWSLNAQWVVQRGFILPFPNAGPLEARSAAFSDAQRDELARSKGRDRFDISEDKWFDTSLFPNRAQAPYTLRNFPTRFPDVRTHGLNSWELSAYKDFLLGERARFQVRGDFQNAFNHPVFGQLTSGGDNVTNARFGQLRADMNNEPRRIVLVMKIIF